MDFVVIKRLVAISIYLLVQQLARLNYKPLTDSSVYTKDTKGSYPNINIQNARQVISSAVVVNIGLIGGNGS
jgi:hypothetical protein